MTQPLSEIVALLRRLLAETDNPVQTVNNMRLAHAAREHLPRLLDEIERRELSNRRLRAALQSAQHVCYAAHDSIHEIQEHVDNALEKP